jgi:hypothetical protein
VYHGAPQIIVYRPMPKSFIMRLRSLITLTARAWIAAFIGVNIHSLREGLIYLAQMRRWSPKQRIPLRHDGPFGDCYTLVELTNAARSAHIRKQIQRTGVSHQEQQVPGEPLPNFFVRLGPPGPMTLILGHYDKSRETPTYQGASDNTAAVTVLLAVLRELATSAPNRGVGILFSAAEERGYLGAKAFLAHAHGMQIEAVINCDMFGRGRIAVRPSALPGFYIHIPLAGWFAYDGRRIRRGGAYQQPERNLIARLREAIGSDLVVYRRFTASSDSNVFQAAGLPTVALSSDDIFYLDSVWERDSDQVELLDERHLELARRLLLHLAYH